MIKKINKGILHLNGTFSLKELVSLVQEHQADYFKREPFQLLEPETSIDYLQAVLGARESEAFAVIFLDQRHRVISCEILFEGTVDGSAVYPREVVKKCMEHNAAAVVVSHNHPSGITTPSTTDKEITQRLKDALGLIDVRLLDHIIIGEPGEAYSMVIEKDIF